jgi:hypothetical protein
MRIAILILGILGSFVALGVGACSGACAAGLGGAAGNASEGQQLGNNLVMWALLQFVLGLVGAILAFRALGRQERAKKGAIVLAVATAFSVTNTFSFLTAGLLHVIAAILAFVAKPTTAVAAATAQGG